MKTTPVARSRRAGAGVAIGALALSGLVFASPAQAADHIIPSHTIDLSETRSTGHNVFGDDGIHVYTEGATSTDKAAGYFDVNVSLDEIGEPGFSWTPIGGAPNTRPGSQLKVDFDNDGNLDGILVGEPIYGNDWWLSNGSENFVKDDAPSHTGGSGSDNHGTLAQWRVAFPNAEVLQAGWSLGSGVKGDGTINSFTIAGDEYYFVKSNAVATKKLYKSDVDTSSTREKGHNTFRPTSGVRTWTDPIVPGFPGDAGQYEGYVNKAAGFFPIGESLDSVGEPKMQFRTTSGSIPPGLWLDVDADNDGDFDGTLISEASYYGNDWWLNQSGGIMFDNAPDLSGGSGSDHHGKLSEWRAAFPDAKVMKSGWSLGGGVEGDFIIDAITVGLTKYTFTGANRAPVAANKTASTTAGHAVTFALAATDADGDPLTYSVGPGSNGTLSVSGNQATFTPTFGYAGSSSMTYSVNDGRGGTDSGAIVVGVGKSASNMNYSVLPATGRTTKTPIYVKVKVVTAGGDVEGGMVTVTLDGKYLKQRPVGADGRVTIALAKLKKGSHTVKTEFVGTDSASSTSRTKSFTIKAG